MPTGNFLEQEVYSYRSRMREVVKNDDGKGHKKTPAFQGSGNSAHSPHLAECSAGIGTLPVIHRRVAGLHRAVSLHLS